MLALILALALAQSSGAPFDVSYPAVGTSGPQTMSGPLTITSAAGTNALNLTCGARLNFCPTDALAYMSRTAADQLTAHNHFQVLGSTYCSGNLYPYSTISNPGASYGGSLAINDPLRNLSTTEALFESSTAATGGVDVGFRHNTLVALAATDYHSSWTVAGGAPIMYLTTAGTLVTLSSISTGNFYASNTYFGSPVANLTNSTSGGTTRVFGQVGAAANGAAATTGGPVYAYGGTGGAASATKVGAAGGIAYLHGGDGGAIFAGGGFIGGAGAAITVYGGTGANGCTGGACAARPGGDSWLYGGQAGSDSGGGGATGGAVYIKGG
ncbi:MAG: hypothetical protein V1784_07180, partial [bacterium]